MMSHVLEPYPTQKWKLHSAPNSVCKWWRVRSLSVFRICAEINSYLCFTFCMRTQASHVNSLTSAFVSYAETIAQSTDKIKKSQCV